MEREARHLRIGLGILFGSTILLALILRAAADPYTPTEGGFLIVLISVVLTFLAMVVLYHVYPFKLLRAEQGGVGNLAMGISLLALFFVFVFGIRYLNGRLDDAEPIQEQYFVMDKRTIGSPPEAEYFLILQSDEATGGRTERAVPAELYHRAAPAGSFLLVRSRPGAFGFGWGEEVALDRF